MLILFPSKAILDVKKLCGTVEL